MKQFSPLLFAFSVLCLTGCDGKWWHNAPGYGGEWWTRGQVRSPQELLNNSRQLLQGRMEEFKAARPEIAPLAAQVEKSLSTAYSSLESGRSGESISPELQKAAQAMLDMEGKLSIGSRAAHGELCGELRTFEQKVRGLATNEAGTNNDLIRNAFGTYAARAFSFLANELSVPAPAPVVS